MQEHAEGSTPVTDYQERWLLVTPKLLEEVFDSNMLIA